MVGDATTFQTAHPSPWANEALNKAQAAATELASATAAALTDATNQANATQADAHTKADGNKQKAIDKAAQAKQAALNAADQAIAELTEEWDEQRALALNGLYNIVDLPWEPRPGADLPEAPFTLDDDILDYAPRFVDTWFASVGTPQAVMVLSQASAGGLPYHLIGTGAMFRHTADDGGDGGLGPNGTNRTAARTSINRRSDSGMSGGFFNVRDEAGEARGAEQRLHASTSEEVTGVDGQSGPSPDDLMKPKPDGTFDIQLNGAWAGDLQPVIPAPPQPPPADLRAPLETPPVNYEAFLAGDAGWQQARLFGVTPEAYVAARAADSVGFYQDRLREYIAAQTDPWVQEVLTAYLNLYGDNKDALVTLLIVLTAPGRSYSIRAGDYWFEDWHIPANEMAIYLNRGAWIGMTRSPENLAQQLHEVLSTRFYGLRDLPETGWMFTRRVGTGVLQFVGGAGAALLGVPMALMPFGVTQVAGFGLIGFGGNWMVGGGSQLFSRDGGINPLQELVGANEELWLGERGTTYASEVAFGSEIVAGLGAGAGATRWGSMPVRGFRGWGGARSIGPTNNIGGWLRRPEGTRLRQVGNYWIKEVDPDASAFMRWWGRGSLEAQARGLDNLGDMATPHFFKNGKLVMRDAGQFSGSAVDFLSIRARGSWRLGTPFNDIWPRNIGANGLLFDPALHPLHEGAWWTLGGVVVVGGGTWAYYEWQTDE